MKTNLTNEELAESARTGLCAYCKHDGADAPIGGPVPPGVWDAADPDGDFAWAHRECDERAG